MDSTSAASSWPWQTSTTTRAGSACRHLQPRSMYTSSILPSRELDTAGPAEEVYGNLEAAGLSVLYDDREERAGIKFNDADLIGLPLRVTVGEKGLANANDRIESPHVRSAPTRRLAGCSASHSRPKPTPMTAPKIPMSSPDLTPAERGAVMDVLEHANPQHGTLDWRF